MPSGSAKQPTKPPVAAAEKRHCAFEDLDHSVLQEPLNLGITNVKQILKCVQSGSREVKDIVINECNIIYECKVCLALFRSLANLMYHKRCYCKRHVCEKMVLFRNFDEGSEEQPVPLHPKMPPEDYSEKNSEEEESSDIKDVLPKMMECTVELVKAHVPDNIRIPESVQKGSSGDMKDKKVAPSSKPESSMISRRTRDKNNLQVSNAHKLPVESSSDEEPPPKSMKVAAKDSEKDKSTSCDSKNSSAIQSPVKQNKTERNEVPIKCTIAKSITNFPKFVLKPIGCKSGTILQNADQKKTTENNITIKNLQNFPMQTKLDNNKLVIVLKKKEAPAGGTPEAKPVVISKQRSESQKLNEFHLTRRKRLMSRSDCNVHELKCLVCKTQFMSLKTLYFHMLSLHSKKRLYYPCPFCKTLFVQMYGVTRHLISIHNKTKEQTNKLREMIKKKSVWKRVDDASLDSPEKTRPDLGIESYPLKQESEPDTKPDAAAQFEVTECSPIKTVIKIGKNSALHKCSKCNRVFGRKSSQVSHEKFCIMNAIKVERSPSPVPENPDVPPAVVPKREEPEPVPRPPSQLPPSVRISARPKRGAEKLMHKDFVNSQTLKWRSANKVDTNNKLVPKKNCGKNLEKKVLTIMDAENLVCLKCDKKFSSISNLRRHVAIHVGWTRFKCKHCDYQAYNKSQCWSHVQKTHPSSDADVEKSIVHLSGGNLSSRKSFLGNELTSKVKRSPDGKSFSKNAAVAKMKASKRKSGSNLKNLTVIKKSANGKKESPEAKRYSADVKKEVRENKKDSLDGKKDARENKKDILESKKDVRSESKKDITDNKKDFRESKKDGTDSKKDIRENKKDVSDAKKECSDGKRDTYENKKESTDGKKDVRENKKDADAKKEQHDHKKETQGSKPDNLGYKREVHERKNEKESPESNTENDKKEKLPLVAIPKFCVPQYKKEINYKSMTTSNPTTIILSKKIPSSSSVQSIVAIAPGSSVRTSPRKNEVKFPEIKQLPKLLTRSNIRGTGPPTSIHLKLPVRSSLVGGGGECAPEKTYARKDRLISEWFPKKDLNSNNARRESAPVIIGLVPASESMRAKTPGMTFNSPR